MQYEYVSVMRLESATTIFIFESTIRYQFNNQINPFYFHCSVVEVILNFCKDTGYLLLKFAQSY